VEDVELEVTVVVAVLVDSVLVDSIVEDVELVMVVVVEPADSVEDVEVLVD
jgi:hypothetical protein